MPNTEHKGEIPMDLWREVTEYSQAVEDALDKVTVMKTITVSCLPIEDDEHLIVFDLVDAKGKAWKLECTAYERPPHVGRRAVDGWENGATA